ncbi:MAG: S41 family peptidase [Myxococcota bacterium]
MTLVLLVGCSGGNGSRDPGGAVADDTGLGVLGMCAEDEPNGRCGGDRICLGGRCVVPVDPGEPVSSSILDEWTGVWQTLDRQYAAFDAKPDLDWPAVFDAVAADLPSAQTQLEAVYRMSLGVAEIGDGHTYLRHPICDGLAVPPVGFSNIGACFVEGEDGQILVNQVSLENPMGLLLGDRLISVDGRPAEWLIADLGAQPGCVYVGSSPEMTRAGHVQSLGWRGRADRVMRIARPDGAAFDLDIRIADVAMRCDGRTPPLTQGFDGGLEWARLAGDIGYLYFPFFGSTGSDGVFQAEPLQSSVRAVLADNDDIRGLVLDLRANGGGFPSIYFALASYLYDEQTTLFFGGDGNGNLFPQVATPDPELQLDVPVAVLVSARAFSAADFTSGFLIQTGRARAFGQPSGGGFGGGGVATFGDYTLGVNTYAAYDLNEQPYEGNPPPVDEPLRPRRADLALGRDTILDAALEWLDDAIE